LLKDEGLRQRFEIRVAEFNTVLSDAVDDRAEDGVLPLQVDDGTTHGEAIPL
jgi:hypothetical protein